MILPLAQAGTAQVRELQDILGGGPLAGVFALLLTAIVILFWLLMRAKNDTRDMAAQVLPRIDKMLATVEALVRGMDVLQDSVLLHRHVIEKTGTRRKTQPPPGSNVLLPEPVTPAKKDAA